jgi:hypothetical protein
MRKAIIAVVGLATLVTILGPSAQADPGEATHIDSLSATVGTNIQVSGAATFVDAPKLVGEDGADALVPGIGADIRSVTLSRSAPKGKINFTLGIGDQPATLNGIPETVAYLWDITVTSPSGSASNFELWAARSAQWAAAGATEPVFRRYICTAGTASNDCGSATTVTGRMQDGVVEWQVPVADISATPGSVISSSSIEVSPTAAGAVWGVLRLDGSGASQDEEYTVPGPTVKLGIAPAGTPAEQVLVTANAPVNLNTSAFAGIVAKPAQPGNYIVVAEACYTGADCVRSSTPVTVA